MDHSGEAGQRSLPIDWALSRLRLTPARWPGAPPKLLLWVSASASAWPRLPPSPAFRSLFWAPPRSSRAA